MQHHKLASAAIIGACILLLAAMAHVRTERYPMSPIDEMDELAEQRILEGWRE